MSAPAPMPMRHGPSNTLALGVYVLLSVPLLFWNLAGYSLVNLDEGVLHHMARQMSESGNWLRVEYLGEQHVYDTLMKAPLQYWIRAGAISLLGDGYWAMRLPSALFGLATVIAVHALVRFVASPRAAFLAGLAQLTTLQFVYLHGARTGESETLTCFLYALTALLYLRTLERGGSWVPHHLCLFAFANVKIPLIFVPLLAEGLHLLVVREARVHFVRWARTGLLLAPVGLAWQIGHVVALGSEALDALRTMSGEASGDVAYKGLEKSFPERISFYGRQLLFGAFPYSLAFVPAALLALRVDAGRRSAVLALVFFAAAVLAFFLGVSKTMPWYVMPVYPMAAALLGVGLDELLRGGGLSSKRARQLACATAGAILALAASVHFRPGAFGGAPGTAADFDPFARAAWTFDPRVEWRAFGPWALAAGIVLGTLCARFASLRWVGAVLAAALLGSATWRCARPLRHTDYLSPLEQRAIEVDRARRAGTLALPQPIPASTREMAHVFFADEYKIGRSPRGSEFPFQIHAVRKKPRRPPGSAIWIDRSRWPASRDADADADH